MNHDPREIIITESCCDSCSTNMVRVHHHHFPELQLAADSVERAVEMLVARLLAEIDCIPDPSHREGVHRAIDDAHAFLERRAAVR